MAAQSESRYFDPLQEKRISEFEIELVAFSEAEGKHTGIKNRPVTEVEYRAYIMNHIEAKTQSEIDFNHQHHTPVSGMVVANQFRKDAGEKIKPLEASLAEDESKLRPLLQLKKSLRPNLQKRNIRRLVYAGITVLSTAEGYFAYEGFRSAPMPKIPSVVCSVAIAVAVGFGCHVLGGYIQKSKTRIQKILRYSYAIIPALIGFYMLGHLRADAYNQAIRINSEIAGSEIPTTSSVNEWSLTIISSLLFIIALMLSVKFHKTEEESRQEHEYDKLCNEIKVLENKKNITTNAIADIEKEAEQKAAEAFRRWDYAKAVEKRLQTIARKALMAFNDTNLKYRTDGIVSVFFSFPPPFSFRLFFDYLKPFTNEDDISTTAA